MVGRLRGLYGGGAGVQYVTTMSIEKQFLSDILAHPEDDAPRLIYADWLEDHGDPDRAELFRAQIERAKLSRHDPRYEELERREEALIAKHKARWGGKVAKYVDDFDFWRGMPESVVVSMAKFNRCAEWLFAAAPVDTVSIGSFNRHRVAGLAKCRHLARVRFLDLSGMRLWASDIRHLAACTHLERLRILELSNNRFDVEGVQALMVAPFLPQLESLKLGRCWFGDGGAAALAHGPVMPHLEALDLSDDMISPAGVELLAGSKNFPRLKSLSLAENRIYPDAPVLGRAPWLATLEELHLERNGTGAETVLALAANPAFRPKELTLQGAKIGESAEAFFRSGVLERIEWLDLATCGLGTSGVKALSRSPAPPALRRLGLSWNEIGDEGAKALARWPGLARVIDLRLTENGLTEAGLRALLASPHLRELQWLIVSVNKVGDDGAAALAAWPGLHRLTHLNVEKCGLTAKGKKALRTAREWGEALKL